MIYYRMDLYELAEKRHLSIRQIADFLSPVNPFGPSNKAKYAIRRSIKELSLFPDEKGRRLRRVIGKIEGVGEEYIFFSHGLECQLRILLDIFRPKALFVFGPISKRRERFFSSYPFRIIDWGIKEKCPFEQFLSSMREGDILFLSNPHEMTGNVLKNEDLMWLLEEVERKGGAVLIDESFKDFLFDPPPSVAPKIISSSSVLLRSFSIFYSLAGLPFSYGIASRKVVDSFPHQKISSLALNAAIFSLKDKGFKKRIGRLIEEEKAFIKAHLKNLKEIEIIDTEINFIILRFKKEPEGIKERLLEKNILVELSECKGERIMRVPVKKRKFNALLVKSLKEIFDCNKY